MKTVQIDGERPIHLWTEDVEPGAMLQLHHLAQLPFIHPHGVALMPDGHQGIGSTVGSVIATHHAIIPAAVGVDIGCGMNAIRTSLKATDLPDSLVDLRHSIERGVPLGAGGMHKDDVQDQFSAVLHNRLRTEVPESERISTRNAMKQLGTLGSGNHFIEVCLDEQDRVWVMLHSGSRGIGNRIGTFFISKAQELCAKWHVPLPHKDLAYFPEDVPEFVDYWRAVKWAQDYALHNRKLMMVEVVRNLKHHVKDFEIEGEAINCHHNYVDMENHYGQNVYVTRKGAIRAREGDLGIIPGSMGTRSYIVRGRGSAASYHSCSHGAGRRMSRKQARTSHTVEDLVRQTVGVECLKTEAVLDEIPTAYKDIDQVMENQRDLVEPIHTLKAVLCVKGA